MNPLHKRYMKKGIATPHINLKRIWIIGTLALGITLGSSLSGSKVEAEAIYSETPPSSSDDVSSTRSSAFLHALGVSNEQQVYDLMYEGFSLRDIARLSGGHEAQLLTIQIDELDQQLKERLADGQITEEAYIAYKAELPEIIASSLSSKIEIE
ncbi:hypothetical protein [Saccharibacillus sp. JS10]|uniref:hypothetical protein n=1 Tax=Saccharibacillus sp. JS10 TaxID=2950552 RepID=UPI00210E3700|nr:hypothetical protein [Saccharibacillus sp. JS10]MCQ4087588.1 hypothetical protein [Saccharibacillus sp. JS10]